MTSLRFFCGSPLYSVVIQANPPFPVIELPLVYVTGSIEVREFSAVWLKKGGSALGFVFFLLFFFFLLPGRVSWCLIEEAVVMLAGTSPAPPPVLPRRPLASEREHSIPKWTRASRTTAF